MYTEIQKYRNTEIQKYRNTEIQKYRNTEIQCKYVIRHTHVKKAMQKYLNTPNETNISHKEKNVEC